MRLFYFLHFILLRFCPKNIKSYINKKEIQQKKEMWREGQVKLQSIAIGFY